MPAVRRARAVFRGAVPQTNDQDVGVRLCFQLVRSRLDVDLLEDFAALGPDHCLPAVNGLGKGLRILRAGRVAAPDDAKALIGDIPRAIDLLARAIGSKVSLELRPRTRLRFTAWTDESVEVIEDVAEVIETPDTYVVVRQGGRFPARIARDRVVRQLTDSQRWYEILSIERSD